MRSEITTGAKGAPSRTPEALQSARIAARVNVSAAVAGVLAELAFGPNRRDHGALLVDLTAVRTTAAGALRL